MTPFGIQTGPAHFQRTVNDILSAGSNRKGSKVRLWDHVLVYIDDIIIYSNSWREHLDHVDGVLGELKASGMTLDPQKCHFGYQSLLILGHKVSRLGMSTHQEKVEGIVAIKTPTNKKGIQQFIGAMQYFSLYVPWYSDIMKPLIRLLRKDVVWNWGEKEQKAFDQAKAVLQAAPIMAFPIPGLGYRLYTDASNYAISGILQQVQPIKIKELKGTKIYERLKDLHKEDQPIPNLCSRMPDGFEKPRPTREWNTQDWEETIVDIERVIAYWSKLLNQAQRNYAVTERELLAVKESLVKFHALLEGEDIINVTDHSALTWTVTYQGISKRLSNWGTYLQAFPGLKIVHKPGRIHSQADTLSRMEREIPHFESPTLDPLKVLELDNLKEDIVQKKWQKYSMTKEKEAQAATLWTSTEIKIHPKLLDIYLKGYEMDKYFQEIVQALRNTEDWRNPKYRNYFFGEDGLLYLLDANEDQRICVPNLLKNEILKEHSKPNIGKHDGVLKETIRFRKKYFWPTMIADIKKYVLSCDICQKIKSKTHKPYGLLRPIPLPIQPFEVVTMDFITDLPASHGYDSVFVVVDKLTKWVILTPCTKKINELETAKMFKKVVICQYGLPKQIISDRDSRWANDFWGNVLNLLGSQRALTTAHHPQADGQTEAINKILEVAIRAFVNKDLNNWAEFLEDFQLAHNSSINTVTDTSPSWLLLHKEISLNDIKPREPLERTNVTKEEAEEFVEQIKLNRELAREAMLIANDLVFGRQNKDRLPMEFQVGDQVLVNPHTLKLTGIWQNQGHKLLPRYEGPFEIIEKHSPTTYTIRLPPDWNIWPTLNIEHLQPYKESPEEFGDREKKEIAPRRKTSKKEWEVKRILKQRKRIYYRKGKRREEIEYQAEWIFPDGTIQATDEWISAKDFRNAREVVAEWKNKRS